mmetsp:Transcript_23728/g.78839  ORF Transcript_23728/g.78839 Transcript_23728/m.78839 type:complete len:614 (+) Transcript_23728:484-2325(+)
MGDVRARRGEALEERLSRSGPLPPAPRDRREVRRGGARLIRLGADGLEQPRGQLAAAGPLERTRREALGESEQVVVVPVQRHLGGEREDAVPRPRPEQREVAALQEHHRRRRHRRETPPRTRPRLAALLAALLRRQPLVLPLALRRLRGAASAGEARLEPVLEGPDEEERVAAHLDDEGHHAGLVLVRLGEEASVHQLQAVREVLVDAESVGGRLDAGEVEAELLRLRILEPHHGALSAVDELHQPDGSMAGAMAALPLARLGPVVRPRARRRRPKPIRLDAHSHRLLAVLRLCARAQLAQRRVAVAVAGNREEPTRCAAADEAGGAALLQQRDAARVAAPDAAGEAAVAEGAHAVVAGGEVAERPARRPQAQQGRLGGCSFLAPPVFLQEGEEPPRDLLVVAAQRSERRAASCAGSRRVALATPGRATSCLLRRRVRGLVPRALARWRRPRFRRLRLRFRRHRRCLRLRRRPCSCCGIDAGAYRRGRVRQHSACRLVEALGELGSVPLLHRGVLPPGYSQLLRREMPHVADIVIARGDEVLGVLAELEPLVLQHRAHCLNLLRIQLIRRWRRRRRWWLVLRRWRRRLRWLWYSLCCWHARQYPPLLLDEQLD